MKRTLIVLVCALLVLAGLLWKKHSEFQSEEANAFVFDTAQKAGVTSLKVIEKKDTAELLKVGNQWVTARDSFPVDTSKIDKSLTALLQLQDKIRVSTNPARLKEYGLDSSQAKYVAWHGPGGKTAQVILGKTASTDYSSTYWKWVGKPDVFETPGNFTWQISARDLDWKDRSPFHVGEKDIQNVQVEWRDSTGTPYSYKIDVVNDTTYRMVEPESSLVTRNKAQGILSEIGSLSIDDFVAKGDTNLSKIRLDTPMISIHFMTKTGKSYSLAGSQAINNYVYVRYSTRKDTVKMGGWRFNNMKKKPFELVPQKMPPAPAAESPAKEKPGKAKETKVKNPGSKAMIKPEFKAPGQKPPAKKPAAKSG